MEGGLPLAPVACPSLRVLFGGSVRPAGYCLEEIAMRSLNLAFVVASLTVVFVNSAVAQSDQEVYAEADRIFGKAEDAVSENLANFIKANEKPFATARHEMAELISQLNKDGRSQLATSLQRRLNALEDTIQRRASVKVPVVAKQNDLPQQDGWYVLFRSADPSVWDTQVSDDKSLAVPLASAPQGIRFLKMSEGGKTVIIPMTNASLVRDGVVTKTYGWAGDNDRSWGGYHLGIYDTRRPGGKSGEVIVVQNDEGFLGWGFGHVFGGRAIACSWDGQRVLNTAIEIAVKCNDLTPSESKHLLAE